MWGKIVIGVLLLGALLWEDSEPEAAEPIEAKPKSKSKPEGKTFKTKAGKEVHIPAPKPKPKAENKPNGVKADPPADPPPEDQGDQGDADDAEGAA